MNNSNNDDSFASQASSSPYSFSSAQSSWREKIQLWLKRRWLGFASLGLLGVLSLCLLFSGLVAAWFLALLMPGSFENLAEDFLQRIPALLIATPLGILLGFFGVVLLLGLSLGLALMHWLVKRFGLHETLWQAWQKRPSSVAEKTVFHPTSSPTSTPSTQE